MRHRSLLFAACAAVAFSGALMSAAPALAQVPPAPVPAPAATPDAFTYQDMISANRLGDPQVSPDGRYVVYSVTTTDVEANRRSGSLWILDLETPDAAPRRVARRTSPRDRRFKTTCARLSLVGGRPTKPTLTDL